MKFNFLIIITGIVGYCLAASAIPVARIRIQAPRASYLGRLIRRVSFTESWSRYPSPDAILNSLKQDFPYATRDDMTNAHCEALSLNNRKLLGESDPITGRPANEQPNSAFVSWYVNCVSNFILANDRNLNLFKYVVNDDGSSNTLQLDRPANEMVAYFTPQIIAQCHLDATNFTLDKFSCLWTDLSADAQKTYVKKWIELYVGPEDVIQELGIANSEDEFAQNILAEIEDARIKNDNRYSTLGNGSFIFTVRQVTLAIQLLIHLQDTLKY